MKIGMNLFLWTDCLDFEKHRPLLPSLREIGFDGVEFPIEPIDANSIGRFATECDALGLERTCVAVFNPTKYDPASPDRQLRRAAVGAIDELSKKTVDIGADLLSGPFFQGLGRLTGARTTPDEWQWALDTLREGCQRATARGIRIALEPLNRFEMYFANTMADAQRFVRELDIPGVGLLGDTMHANIEELDVTRAYVDALPELMHVHISESTRGTPGSGHGVPDSLIPSLYQSGYDGWLTIEAFSGGATPSMIPALCLWRDPADSADEIARKGYKFISQAVKEAMKCPISV